MDDVLFEMEAEARPLGGPKMRQAVGAAVEYEAVAILLRLGHKVAIPVVDDDGVDLVVNYRTTVQVKSTAGLGRQDKRMLISLVSVSKSEGRVMKQRPSVRPHVDVLLARVENVGWWVIPQRALPPSAWGLSIDGRYDCWREAWHIFESEVPHA